MNLKRKKIAIVTNIITTYRKGFYDRLFNRNDVHVDLFCQDHIPGINLVSIHSDYPKNVHIVNYFSAKNEKIVWQFIPWFNILRHYDLVFVSGNPRVISDVLFGTFCRITNKKVILWTMAHSPWSSKYSEKLRLIWSKIFPIIFVYTDYDVNYLREKGFKNQYILGMNNGLDQKSIDIAIQKTKKLNLLQWQNERGLSTRTIIISSARLVKKNNFALMLDALPTLVSQFPDLLWIVIGGGEEEQYLKSKTNLLGLKDHVIFLGPIYIEELLAPYMLSASIFVHPGGIGLSLLQAFGYALPVIVHGVVEHHGSEYSAFKNGKTGLNFQKDNADDLANKIIELLQSPDRLKEMGELCQYIARHDYNVDIMVERFMQISRHAINK